MKRIFSSVLVAASLAVVGCSNKTDSSAYARPEPYAEGERTARGGGDVVEPQAGQGSEPAFTQAEVAPVSAQVERISKYTVRKGDTLFSIARRVYGNESRWRDIAAANGITDGNRIYVGQEIVLPE